MLKRLLCAAAAIALPAAVVPFAAMANPVGPALHPPFVLTQQTPPPDPSPAVRLHAPAGLTCETAPRRVSSSRLFTDAFNLASSLLTSKRYEEALAAAEIAAAKAVHGIEWSAVESIRVAAFNGLERPHETLEGLEALEALGCGVAPSNRELMRTLREQLSLPPR